MTTYIKDDIYLQMGLFKKKKLILLVDDDRNILQTSSSILEDWNYRVITADNGEIVFKEATENKPDLIILDVMLPGINGFDVCEMLKDNPATSDIPIIMMTGISKMGQVDRGFQAGADEYITKPVDWNRLREKIEQLINR